MMSATGFDYTGRDEAIENFIKNRSERTDHEVIVQILKEIVKVGAVDNIINPKDVATKREIHRVIGELDEPIRDLIYDHLSDVMTEKGVDKIVGELAKPIRDLVHDQFKSEGLI